jgi:hypothetical protein
MVLSCFNSVFASSCGDLEAIQTFKAQQNYRNALQVMGNCLKKATTPISSKDMRLFDDLTQLVLSRESATPLEEVSRNFQSVLKNHPLLTELVPHFKFKGYFQVPNEPEAQKSETPLFSDVFHDEETYYFYYDVGRLFANARGIALTEQALMWKNLLGNEYRIAFDEVQTLTLLYDHGFSLNRDLSTTGWKLQINDDPNHEIRLSRVPDEAIAIFVRTLNYFINSQKTTPDEKLVNFKIPARERAILAGWITLCSETYINQNKPLRELPLLDKCFSDLGNDFKLSQTDHELLKKLTAQIFSPDDVPFEQSYNNFRVVLSTHFFKDFPFKFKSYNFDAKTEDKLFKDIRLPTENYYFYFDMGQISSVSRGLALTEQAILWKNLMGHSIKWNNLTGSAHRLAFAQISQVALQYETSLSALHDWKLKLNEDYEIVLSDLSVENVERFAQAFVYFINIASNANLTLQVPNETRAVLEKAFSER